LPIVRKPPWSGDIVTYVVSRGTRNFLALLVGVAVLYFGSTGNDGRGPTRSVIILAVAAAAIVWYLLRPQDSAGSSR
jgi:predicted ABC-type sugar transport system permease subunit